MGRPPVDIPMNVHLIGDHPHVIIAPTGHRLARKPRLRAEHLAGETFLTREPGSGTRGLMEQLFETAGVRPKIGMAMSSNETIKQAVIAGLGIAFISAHTVATELDERRLVTLDVDGLPVVRQWFVLSRKDKVLLPPAQAMLDFLSAKGAQFLPRTHGRLRLTRSSARTKQSITPAVAGLLMPPLASPLPPPEKIIFAVRENRLCLLSAFRAATFRSTNRSRI